MQEQPAADSGKPGPRYNWSEVWTAALTRPSVQTFEHILQDEGAGLRRGVIWIVAAAALATVMLTAFNLALVPDMQALMAEPGIQGGMPAFSSETITLMLLIAAPFTMILLVGGFVMMAAVVHGLAFAAGGRRPEQAGLWQKLFYALAAAQAPLLLLGSFVRFVPCVGTWLLIVVYVYVIVLARQAVQAVYGLDRQRAFWVGGLPYMGLFSMLLFFSFVLVMLMVMMAG